MRQRKKRVKPLGPAAVSEAAPAGGDGVAAQPSVGLRPALEAGLGDGVTT